MESAAVLQEIQRVAVLRESAEKRVRGAPLAVPATEPSHEEVDRGAASVRVTDTGVMCRRSYVLSVLCMRLEEMLG